MSTTQQFESVTKTRKPRTPRAARKATLVEDTTIVNEVPLGARPRDMFDELADQLRAQPSIKRVVCGFVAYAFAAAGLIAIGAPLINALLAMASTWAFLHLALTIFSFMLMVIGSIAAGSYALEYIVSKRIDTHYNTARNWVTGKLGGVGAWIDERRGLVASEV